MIDKDSYGLKKERNVLQEPYKEKENNSKNSDDISLMTNINKIQISWGILKEKISLILIKILYLCWMYLINSFFIIWSKQCL